jgi:hypothetical protein
VVPECVDDTCEQEMAKADPFEWFEFTPTAVTPDTAYIFYPGATIDVRAYAPPAREIAKYGYLVVLVPMPGGAAIGYPDRAASVIDAHPEISNWFLGGHSMGGGAAIAYENRVLNGELIPSAPLTGLIPWAAYGTVEFPIETTTAAVTIIYEAEKADLAEAGRPYVPADTEFIMLEGVNHAQFGYYGEQEGDYDAKMTHVNQTEIVVAATVHSIRRVLAGSATEHALYAAAEPQLDTWCELAQQTVANTDPVLDTALINNVMTDSIIGFRGSSATIDLAAGSPINIASLPIFGGNATSLNAPPVYKSEIFCKMKDQQSIVRELSDYDYVGGTPDIGTCAQMNETAYNWARGAVSSEELAAYDASGVTLTFGVDGQSTTGPGWLFDDQNILEETSPGVYQLTAAGLLVPSGVVGNPDKEEVLYCKLWSPARAVYWILEQK